MCVSVSAKTADDLIAKIARADELADIIEVRFDCLEPSEIQKAIHSLPAVRANYLFTFRPQTQGGMREISVGESLKFWEILFHHQSSDFMIDVEGEPKLVAAIRPSNILRIL